MERARLGRSPRRYRIEHRRDDGAAVVLAFADGFHTATVQAGLHRRRLWHRGVRGTVAIVDHATETDLMRYPIGEDPLDRDDA
jgi:hypothetical protein